MRKGKSGQKVAVYAYDKTINTAKTGDAANITAHISKDGGTSAATNDTNPTELDSTNHAGVYIFDLTVAESKADLAILSSSSSTSNIILDPIFIYTEHNNARWRGRL